MQKQQRLHLRALQNSKKNKPVKLVFNLSVTDNKKAKKSDKVTVTINSATPTCVSPKFFKNGVCTASSDPQAGVKVKQLAAGYMHTCALFEDETVKCWGDNYYGQLGLEHRDEIGNDPIRITTHCFWTFKR
jgi:alpha-tubulin suppressor-like RCC1 family protein